MNISVTGNGPLAAATAAGLAAAGHHVIDDPAAAQIAWFAAEPPGDLLAQALDLAAAMSDGALLAVAAPLPIGAIARIERETEGRVRVACVPPASRPGAPVVAGVRDDTSRALLETCFAPTAPRIEWMSVESAELTRHAVHAFLALSICFANEVASLCEHAGADPAAVERGLRSDPRIGPAAYVRPGPAFADGRLARDVAGLLSLHTDGAVALPLLTAVHGAHEHQKNWLRRRVAEVIPSLAGRTVALLGLAYKPGAPGLAESHAPAAIEWLYGEGARVQAYDPQIGELPPALAGMAHLAPSAGAALAGAEALIVLTGWPEFVEIEADSAPKLVFDPGRHLEGRLAGRPGTRYFAIGRTV